MRRTAFLCTLLFAFVVLGAITSPAQVRITVAFGPPALPVYEQPVCPGDGYIWTPGYWAWDDEDGDYYWVPGTWVLAPEVGYLWTPPWWGWEDNVYLFHAGYWGPHVGFYGGIVYGFGYFGFGFDGGRWENDHFFYNRSVTNVNVVNVRNVYNETVVNNNVTVNRVSYNGGPGGITARPRPEDEIAAHDRHIPPVAAQTQHIQTARSNPELRANTNHGRPPIAATPRPTEFRGSGVVQAREAGGPYHPPANRNVGQPAGNNARAVHPNDLPKLERPASPNSGNANLDRKYQQQQDKLFAKQERERQKLQQKQDQEHQRMDRQNASQAQRQQMEERHQQQTQQMRDRHVQQQQQMQQRQAPEKRR
jgi:WXXGXW repeat (2 copies)